MKEAGKARQWIAILLLPGAVTILAPAVLLVATQSWNPGWGLPERLRLIPTLSGALLIIAGALLAGRSAAVIARSGKGTLAPWDPPRRLVVRGLYRRVRNPMISGIFAVLLGEALLSGSPALLAWFALFVFLNIIYIPLSEEPELEKRFGEAYLQYKAHVPRWIPRQTPWEPPFGDGSDVHLAPASPQGRFAEMEEGEA